MSAHKFSHHFVPHHHAEIGEHHRAHALNPGALLFYLVIFVFIIFGFYFVRSAAPQILGTAQYTAAQIVELTNIKRAEQGLSPLTLNSKLSSAAYGKALDMLANNYWAHYSPQGKSPWNFIKAAGYRYIYAGENLARDFNDPQSLVNAWMASPTHRSNILDKNFKEIGVSVESGKLTGREGVLVVQMFGSSVSQVPKTDQVAKLPASNLQTQGESSQQEEAVENVEEGSLPEVEEVGQLAVNHKPATVLASRQFSISKIITLVLVGFVFLLFVVEVAVASKKAQISIKSSTLAHLGLLALVLFAVWWSVAGAVI